MFLGFKKEFDNQEPTNFIKKIVSSQGNMDVLVKNCINKNFVESPKIHAIRANKRWKEGDKIHFYSGSITNKCDQFAIGVCVSVQNIEIHFKSEENRIKIDGLIIDGKIYDIFWDDFSTPYEIALNEGLSYDRFLDQFYALSEFVEGRNVFTGQIIHWTNYKYL